MSKFCTNCGTKLEDNVKFCTSCGKGVDGEEQAKPNTTVVVNNASANEPQNGLAIAGFVVGMAVMFYLTDMVFGKIRANLLDGKSMKIAIGRAFAATWKQRLIINVAVLVVGIVLWAIPTAITASLGNALVYSAVVSLVATFGTNHLFAIMTGAIQE